MCDEIMNKVIEYTIKQTAELTGFTEDTIRYYEKIGLLPRAERKTSIQVALAWLLTRPGVDIIIPGAKGYVQI